MFAHYFLRPWVAVVVRESHRVADLLGQLPQDVDVQRLMGVAMHTNNLKLHAAAISS